MADEQTTNQTPDTPKASWIWIKDSAGYPSVTVTFATVSFWVTTMLYVLSAFEALGPVKFRPFDVAATSAYFVPILTLYFGRRWTDAKHGLEPGKVTAKPPVTPALPSARQVAEENQ